MFLFGSGPVLAGRSSESVFILGYDGSAWYPYIARMEGERLGSWRKIEMVANPVEVSYQAASRTVFYKDDSGDLLAFDLANESRRLVAYCGPHERPTHSQLRAHAGGLALVELVEGKSRETTIALLDSRDLFPTQKVGCNKPAGQRPVRQSSAQFHPLATERFIYYAHVSCRSICDPIVQDVWRFDRVIGRAEQLTQLNATSYLHSLDEQTGRGYISSNRHGYYHLARIDLETGSLVWLTKGQVTDGHPSIARNGDLYFIRRDASGSRLMRLPVNESEPFSVELPSDIRKLRYLEVSANE
ncbi:hypothetical protein F6455_05245 [Proteobacteria bacterium 005FR1]|nr:hypothetical protein [Proteobacteria bacterium 005FR1]